MKHFCSFFPLILWCSFLPGQPCLPAGITFNDQAQIDAFTANYPNCTEIDGSVFISGSDITDLSGLAALTAVNGGLEIVDCEALTSLDGLDQLVSLTSLAIVSNGALTDLSGLEQLSSIGGPLVVHDNDALISFTGLDHLASVGGYVRVNYNDALSDFDGLQQLSSIGNELFISYNHALKNLHGLENLTSIGSELVILDNDALTSLQALQGVASIGGYLRVEGNWALTSLSGLENIHHQTIADLLLQNGSHLSACDVQSICDYLAISENPATIEHNAAGCNSREEVETACALVAVHPVDDPAIQVFPNPTTGRIEIVGVEPGQIRITDRFGRVVKELEYTGTGIDLTGMPGGVYSLFLHSDDARVTTRIVIQ